MFVFVSLPINVSLPNVSAMHCARFLKPMFPLSVSVKLTMEGGTMLVLLSDILFNTIPSITERENMSPLKATRALNG